MRLSTLAIVAVTFAAGAGLSFVTAGFAVNAIESTSERGVRAALDRDGFTWAEVQADGLDVYLTGTAPTEAVRFSVISTASSVVDATRVIDRMDVKDSVKLAPPRFSIEILRNDSGISLIGLIPAETDRHALIDRIADATDNAAITDLLESADYPIPKGWEKAVNYAAEALEDLPRTKISVNPNQVNITAISDSGSAKRKLEKSLTGSAPRGLRLGLDITAPRPVLTPFTLRFQKSGDDVQFDACSADTEDARAQIISAAQAAGLTGDVDCTIGLGVPSTNWADAAQMAIKAVDDLGGGTVTFADADISLIAPEGTDQPLFDRVIGNLENALPEVFALHSVLPKSQDGTPQGTPEFIATLSPEGLVQLRGRVSDDLSRTATESFARARFGSKSIHVGARVDDSLPNDWTMRVLAGLEALSKLSNGALIVQPDLLSVSGKTGNKSASDEISGLLAAKLDEDERFEIDVTYQEKLDPIASLPTPEECEADIAALLSKQKINFEPGSVTPDAASRDVIDAIGEVLKECSDIRIEIGGHTDSQGREEMNQRLSQSRAQAVLTSLRERHLLTASITAKGYGETQPIADNDTEEGREENRRIEFKLIRPKPVTETETTLESTEQPPEDNELDVEPDSGDAVPDSEEGSGD